MSTNPQSQLDVDLLLSQARHHIAAAERHEKKRDEHHMAAGLCLVQARDSVAPDFDPLARTPKAKAIHDLWWAHLDKHEIVPRTAQRLIAEVEDPQARRIRLEKKYERDRQVRRDAEEARARKAAKETDDNVVVDPVDNSKDTPRSAVVLTADHTSAIRAVKQLTPEQVRAVLAFINTL